MQKETIKSLPINIFSRVYLALRKIRIPWKVTFIAMGVFSMVWVLFRVLSKPQRIDYPCVRAASPIMVSFLSWLFTMVGGVYFFNMSKAAMRRKAIFLSIGLFLVASVLMIFSTLTGSSYTYASEKSMVSTNTPIGTPQGSIPGRVVRIWNPDATNENCTNTFGDAWDLPHNTNLTIVDSMMRESIRNLAGEDNLQDAWNNLFLYFNENKGKGLVDYADYLINLAALKAHMRSGVTLTAKNHFGSFTRGSASHLHVALPNESPGNNLYRPLVDMMGHEKLGGNTLLFVVDGLYPGPDANDFLLQSADSSYWPEGIIYDPENDGTPIGSLGVYERWNNPIDKQYAKELGLGQGIDFVKLLFRTINVQPLRSLKHDNAELSQKIMKILFLTHKSN